MGTNVGSAIGEGLGLFITAKIAGAVIGEAKKINGETKKGTSKQQKVIKELS